MLKVPAWMGAPLCSVGVTMQVALAHPSASVTGLPASSTSTPAIVASAVTSEKSTSPTVSADEMVIRAPGPV